MVPTTLKVSFGAAMTMMLATDSGIQMGRMAMQPRRLSRISLDAGVQVQLKPTGLVAQPTAVGYSVQMLPRVFKLSQL